MKLAFHKKVYDQTVPQLVITRDSLSVLTKYFRSQTEIILFSLVYKLPNKQYNNTITRVLCWQTCFEASEWTIKL